MEVLDRLFTVFLETGASYPWVLGEGVRLAALGAGIGRGASLALAQVAQGVVVDAPVWDVRLAGAAGASMLAVASAAAFIPAHRASAVDPIVVLRNE